MTAITRRHALARLLGLGAAATALVLAPGVVPGAPAVSAAPQSAALRARRVLTERDLSEVDAGNLVALFRVLDGEMAVFANTRLISESSAVAWAERLRAAEGRLFGFWFGGDTPSA